MANRKNTFLLKRSNVAGKVPVAGDLQLGELAINTADVILFASGTTSNSILPIGWDRVARTGDTMTGSLYAPNISATTISATTYLNLPSMSSFYLPLSGGTVYGNTIFTSGLTASTLYTSVINFDINYTGATAVGSMTWNSTFGTPQVGLIGGNVVQKIGETIFSYVRNDEATTLNKGEVVYIFGATGDKISVKRASNTGDTTSSKTLGVVAESIVSGGLGYIITQGTLDGLNLGSYTAGDTLWLGVTPGQMTNVKQYAPNHTVFIGVVQRANNGNGQLYVLPQNGYELEELHNVMSTGATYGDLLTFSAYNGSNVWVNSKTLNGSYTITGDTTVGGQLKATSVSATTISAATISAFKNIQSDTISISNAAAYFYGKDVGLVIGQHATPPYGTWIQSNRNDNTPYALSINPSGGNVGIGTSSPNYKLDISGEVAIRGAQDADDARMYFQASDNSNRFIIETDLDDYPSEDLLGFRGYSVDNILILKGDGNIGIGTNTPKSRLDVLNTSSGSVVDTITVRNASNAINTEAGIFFAPTLATGSTRGARISGYQEDGNNIIGLKFYTGVGGSISERMRISAEGNVGIGTNTPNHKLHVSGNTLINGNITATTVSATTYLNLPTDVRITGATYSNNTFIFTNNTGGTFNTLFNTLTGLTVNGDLTVTGNTIVSGSTTVTGDVNSLGYLRSYNSNGDEGGEIFLNKAQTNTTLSGGFTIDVYQNKIRFFEQGGTARGAFIDLTACIGGASTNLLSGGGGEINTASNLGTGTGLFAQKSAADLQFKSLTSTGGTVTITNNSTTVNLEVVPASNFTGGTVNGATRFTNGLTANTISATTYQNLPIDIRVTGGTYNAGTATFTNNTGGTFTVTGFSTGGGTFNGGTVTGATYFTGGVSANTLTASGTGQNILTVIGSGNSTTSPLFSVIGSQGELFSVSDSLTGSLFSVNDISGLPIVEVFSDNTMLMGSYQAPSLNTTVRLTLTAGTNTVYSIPTSAYTGAFIDYTVISSGATGARAGTIMAIWSGTTAQYTDVSTNDIGTTAGISFSVAVVGSNAVLSSSATTAGWTLKTIVRSI